MAETEPARRRARALAALFGTSQLPVLLIDGSGVVVDAGAGFLALVGAPSEQVVGSPLDQWFEPHPIEGLLSLRSAGAWSRTAAGSWRGEVVVARATTTPARARLTLLRCPAAAGDDELVLGIVSEEEDGEEISRRLVAADRLTTLALLAGSAAHEIKNDLGPLLGYLSLFEAEGREGMIAAMQESVRRIQAQAEQIVAPLRPRVDSRAPMSIARAVDGALARLRRAGRLRRVDLRVDCDEDLVVLADSLEVEQLVVSLVTNALDALGDGSGASRGSISITLTAREGDARLVVEDSGPGFPASLRARAIEPFVSSKGSLGAGLGLAAVHTIVRSLGGRLWMEAGADLRTRVLIDLPRDLGAEAPP